MYFAWSVQLCFSVWSTSELLKTQNWFSYTKVLAGLTLTLLISTEQELNMVTEFTTWRETSPFCTSETWAVSNVSDYGLDNSGSISGKRRILPHHLQTESICNQITFQGMPRAPSSGVNCWTVKVIVSFHLASLLRIHGAVSLLHAFIMWHSSTKITSPSHFLDFGKVNGKGER
jgi:hypothetical protein